MEMEAVIEEHASLESQLTCLRGQIDSLTSEVDQLKNKVPFNICFGKLCNMKFNLLASLSGFFSKEQSWSGSIWAQFDPFEDEGMWFSN